MSANLLVVLAIAVPLIGAVGIAVAGHHRPNIREAVTLITAAGLAVLVGSLFLEFTAGARPEVRLV